MATVLLVGSGLVLRSFQKLRHVDLGFRPDGVVTFRIALPYSRYKTSESVAQFHYAMLDRIRTMAGVEVAGATGTLPLSPSFAEYDPLRMEGVTAPPDVLPPLAEMRVATPGYFEAMGIPVVAGRPLERSDTDRITGAVLVTQSIVRKVMQGRPPIGARVAHGVAKVSNERPWSDVVGVVGDVRGVSLDQEPVGAVYYAMRPYLVVRRHEVRELAYISGRDDRDPSVAQCVDGGTIRSVCRVHRDRPRSRATPSADRIPRTRSSISSPLRSGGNTGYATCSITPSR